MWQQVVSSSSAESRIMETVFASRGQVRNGRYGTKEMLEMPGTHTKERKWKKKSEKRRMMQMNARQGRAGGNTSVISCQKDYQNCTAPPDLHKYNLCFTKPKNVQTGANPKTLNSVQRKYSGNRWLCMQRS